MGNAGEMGCRDISDAGETRDTGHAGDARDKGDRRDTGDARIQGTQAVHAHARRGFWGGF